MYIHLLLKAHSQRRVCHHVWVTELLCPEVPQYFVVRPACTVLNVQQTSADCTQPLRLGNGGRGVLHDRRIALQGRL